MGETLALWCPIFHSQHILVVNNNKLSHCHQFGRNSCCQWCSNLIWGLAFCHIPCCILHIGGCASFLVVLCIIASYFGPQIITDRDRNRQLTTFRKTNLLHVWDLVVIATIMKKNLCHYLLVGQEDLVQSVTIKFLE